jgi:hypothetical protein
LLAVLCACAAEPARQDEPAGRAAAAQAEPPAPETAPPDTYFGRLRDRHDAWPMAIVGGTFRIVDGCAMVGDHLLVLPRGSTLAGLAVGAEVEGGGGEFPLASFKGRNAPWALIEPIPERCARLASKAFVAAGLKPRRQRAPGAPEFTPPPPVADPADCPPGTRHSFGLCRAPDGKVVPARRR